MFEGNRKQERKWETRENNLGREGGRHRVCRHDTSELNEWGISTHRGGALCRVLWPSAFASRRVTLSGTRPCLEHALRDRGDLKVVAWDPLI